MNQMMRPDRNSKKKIRILVADREGIFRLGLKKILDVEDDLRVVAQAENGPETLRLAQQFKADLVFVQAELATDGSGDLVAQLRQNSPSRKIVIMASSMHDEEALRHTKAGASGVILKSVEPTLFVKCARKVTVGEVWLPKRQVAQMAQMLEATPARAQRPVDTLTKREKVIISHLAQGWRNREIGQHLSITEQTVKNHLRAIYDKVGVSDRLELVLYAIHQHLELPPVNLDSPPSPS